MLFSLLFILFSFQNFSLSYASESHVSDSDSCQHSQDAFRCVKYIDNYDGDTIKVIIPGVDSFFEEISVRVLGVDTPEIRGGTQCEKDKAKEVKAIVRELLEDAIRIDLLNVSRGKYFRIVAEVELTFPSGTILLSEYLLDNGYAYPYDGGTKQEVDWCE